MTYSDKNVQTISNDVEKEFKKIDKIKYRDDQEIMNAWWNICNNYIKEIKADSSSARNSWALEPLTKLVSSLHTEYNNVTWIKILTNNKDKINSIANRIDNAENEILQRLKLNKANQESKDMVTKAVENHWGKELFEMEKVNWKESWNIVFTKESNPVKIHDALKGLFEDPNQVYQIDYSQCTNQKIKDKMTWLIGAQKCYLRYDATQNTYTIRDAHWNWISNRALIWEGVKLIPAWVRQWEAYTEEKKANESLWKVDNITDSMVNEMLKYMPSAKNLDEDRKKKIVSASENRLQVLVKKAKQMWYELASEPITKKHIGSGLMEMEVISWTSEKSRTIWWSEWKWWAGAETVDLWKELYDFLDWEESEYKSYLTNVVKRKRQEMDKIAKTEKVEVWDESYGVENKETIKKNLEKKEQVLYWIWLMEQFLDNLRETEWNSWADNDDKLLVQMKQLLRNARTSIGNSDKVWDENLIKNVIDPLWNNWKQFKRISEYMNTDDGTPIKNPNYDAQYNYIKDAILWNRENQINAIRRMWSLNRIFDKTETSFLQQEIEWNENLKVKDWGEQKNTKDTENTEDTANIETIQKNIDNIDTILYISDEDIKCDEVSGEIIPNPKTKLIDTLYTAALSGDEEDLIGWLETNKILPENRNAKKKTDKLVRESVNNLRNKLIEKDKLANNFPATLESIAQGQHEEKLALEQKENKTESDLQRLQALEYLENNHDERDRLNQRTLNTLKADAKYWDIQQLVKWSLYSMFVELGWWAIWENGDIYNDIVWYGFWNASDKNAKMIWEIAKEIAITVAVCVATWWMWSAAIAWLLRWAASGARALKRANLANKISKIAKVAKYSGKFSKLSTVWKITRIGTRVPSLLLEWTVFNAASNVVHSAMNWTSLDNINLNPIAKENIQTAAFLGALSVWNQIWWKIISKLHGTTKLEFFNKANLLEQLKNYKWLLLESVGTETAAMMLAEQSMNITFWHDVINPETWEIETSRSLTWPTKEERCQMIGMILAFKAVRPTFWHNIEQKLNNWTLEICRSTKKWEFLVRDTKTWGIKSLQKMIDEQYNDFKPTPEQQRLSNQNRRLEVQSKALENAGKELNIKDMWLGWVQKQLQNIPEWKRSETVKKLLSYKDIFEVSSNDIKRLQRELWFTGRDVDWIFWKESAKKLLEQIWFSQETWKPLTTEKSNSWRSQEELKRLQEENSKRQAEAEKKQAELQQKKTELERQRQENRENWREQQISIENISEILSKWNIITIDWLKYKFNRIEWWKAKFNIKESEKWSDKYKEMNPKPEDNIKITDLAELKNPRFNLEPWDHDNNKRYAKLDELLAKQKIEPLDRLNNKIRNKKVEIKTLQEEIARLEKWSNTIAHNDYFEKNKTLIKWKCIYIEDINYKASIDEQWALHFKQVDWKNDFTVSSFSKLEEIINKSKKWWNLLTNAEAKDFLIIKTHLNWEKSYLKERNIDSEIAWKKAELTTLNTELTELNSKLAESEAQAVRIQERAKRWEEINKELNKVNEELSKVEQQLEETKRLAKKYADEISELESNKNSKETKAPELEWKKQPDIRENFNLTSKSTTEITAQEYVDIIKNNSKEILRLNEINNHEEFCRESFKFLTEKLGITEAKIKLEMKTNTEMRWEIWWYDLQTNTLTLNTERIMDVRDSRIRNLDFANDKSLIFETISHELNHFLQWRNIYSTGNPDFITSDGRHYTSERLIDWAHTDFLEYVSNLRNALPENFELATKYTEMFRDYCEAFDGNGNIKDMDAYKNSAFEKECRERQIKVWDEYKRITEIRSESKLNQSDKISKLESSKRQEEGETEIESETKTEFEGKTETERVIPEWVIQVSWETPSWMKDLQAESTWDFYENWNLKKWKKFLSNWLVYETGEYDINWNMIKWEKYEYNARLYNVDYMPMNWIKKTLFVWHEYLISKEWEINGLWDYKQPNHWDYKYKDGSKFNWEVDKSYYPKQWKLSLQDWTIKEWSFVNWQLREWIEISNNWWNKMVKFVWDVDLNFIKNQANFLWKELTSWEIMEIEIPNWWKLIIKNIEWTLVERWGVQNWINLAAPIEWKLWDYIINKSASANKSKTSTDTDNAQGRKLEGKGEQSDVMNRSPEEIIVEINPVQPIKATELREILKLHQWEREAKYLEDFWSPTHSIDLWNWIQLYTTDVLYNPIKGRSYLIWYVKEWLDVKLRLFYRSKSEWVRRSTPGSAYWKLSKAQFLKHASYETTTKIERHIWEYFDELPKQECWKNKNWEFIDPICDYYDWDTFKWLEILKEDFKSWIQIDAMTEYDNAVDFYWIDKTASSKEGRDVRYNTIQEVKDRYKNLEINWLKYDDMIKKEWKNYSYIHNYLWTINVEVYKMEYNWKSIDVHFAHSENNNPNQVRIDKIVYSDAKVNNLWVYDRQINAWPLTAKPIDYDSQVPYEASRTRERISGTEYIDIRDFYQENPMIKRYKELSHIN